MKRMVFAMATILMFAVSAKAQRLEHAYVHHIYAKYPKNKKHKYCKHQVDRNWRQQGNNNPEAIRQRQKMHRHVMNGAR